MGKIIKLNNLSVLPFYRYKEEQYRFIFCKDYGYISFEILNC